MNIYRAILFCLTCGLLLPEVLPAHAQASSGAGVTSTGAVDGVKDPNNGGSALTGARHPLYRLRKSDVVEIRFTFSPEFDQIANVLPDGFIALKTIGDLYAEDLTVLELGDSVRNAYATILRDPEVSVILKDFDRPFFVAGGQVGHPGKFELRSRTSVVEAIAIAGGFTEQ
ncbi:MAG: hypothetical protein AUG89_02990 [Acidobacteria bacterium 13_1_20CM_4_56_7]|nr:MAG: hypothetical protein AUG89_02990 [Acidobacteria bacterium 13_1_20CM_4_56_7]